VRARIAIGVAVVALSAGVFSVGPALAADECNGLAVCLPVAGPWVAIPSGGVDYELACPLPGYIVAGTDARLATGDIDVSFRAEPGSPIGPGVTTRRSVVFRAVRTRINAGATSFRPFIGCIPTRGGGGRALTGIVASAPGLRPTQPLRSIAVTRVVRTRSLTVRLACPSGSRLVGSTHAIAFRQPLPPSAEMLGAVRVRRSVVDGVLVARVVSSPAAGTRAEVQVRALCALAR
jgi:hypothetical protein